MAAGGPWWGAKYSYGVWERFADQANPFLELFLFDPRNETFVPHFEPFVPHFVHRLYAYLGGSMRFRDPSRTIRAEKLCKSALQMRRDL